MCIIIGTRGNKYSLWHFVDPAVAVGSIGLAFVFPLHCGLHYGLFRASGLYLLLLESADTLEMISVVIT